MFGRALIHLPWMATVLTLTVVAGMEIFLSEPQQAEVAREAAVENIRASLARDLSLIESAVVDGSVQQVKEFVSASSALSGLEAMVLLAPDGNVLAASDIALEGHPLPEGDAWPPLTRHMAGSTVTEILREPGSNRVETWASVAFPNPEGGLRAQRFGLLYTRQNLEPALAPMLESSRNIAMQLALALLLRVLIEINLPSSFAGVAGSSTHL